MKKITILSLFLTFVIFLLSAPSEPIIHPGEIIAYRAGGQLIDYKKLGDDTCSAKSILPEGSQYIENSMDAVVSAANKGVNAIHLNIQRTKDNEFVVFHDWMLDCATDGKGVTSQKTLQELQTLNAGYGYTFDDGKTYPWRNKSIKLPSLNEIITQFPKMHYWLNLKTEDEKSVKLLGQYIQASTLEDKTNIVVISTARAASEYRNLYPHQMAISVESTKTCFVHYMLYGWSRFFPEPCKNTVMLVPPKLAKYLWGWPEKFSGRMQQHNSSVNLWIEHNKYNDVYDLRKYGIGLVAGDPNAFK